MRDSHPVDPPAYMTTYEGALFVEHHHHHPGPTNPHHDNRAHVVVDEFESRSTVSSSSSSSMASSSSSALSHATNNEEEEDGFTVSIGDNNVIEPPSDEVKDVMKAMKEAATKDVTMRDYDHQHQQHFSSSFSAEDDNEDNDNDNNDHEYNNDDDDDDDDDESNSDVSFSIASMYDSQNNDVNNHNSSHNKSTSTKHTFSTDSTRPTANTTSVHTFATDSTSVTAATQKRRGGRQKQKQKRHHRKHKHNHEYDHEQYDHEQYDHDHGQSSQSGQRGQSNHRSKHCSNKHHPEKKSSAESTIMATLDQLEGHTSGYCYDIEEGEDGKNAATIISKNSNCELYRKTSSQLWDDRVDEKMKEAKKKKKKKRKHRRRHRDNDDDDDGNRNDDGHVGRGEKGESHSISSFHGDADGNVNDVVPKSSVIDDDANANDDVQAWQQSNGKGLARQHQHNRRVNKNNRYDKSPSSNVRSSAAALTGGMATIINNNAPSIYVSSIDYKSTHNNNNNNDDDDSSLEENYQSINNNNNDDDDDDHDDEIVLSDHETMSPQEESEKEQDRKKRRHTMLLSIGLVFLLMFIFGLVFGLKGDDNTPGIVEWSKGTLEDTAEVATSLPSMEPSLSDVGPWWILDTPVSTITNTPQEGGGTTSTSVAPVVESFVHPTTQPPHSNAPVILMEETIHPIDLILDNVPQGYNLPNPVLTSLLSFVKDMVKANLDDSIIELVDVVLDDQFDNTRSRRNLLRSSSSSSLLTRRRRRLASISIPLIITVDGPATISGLHILYVMNVLQNTSEIQTYLKSLNGGNNAFGDVTISLESESFELGNGGTVPSVAPTTPSPVANNIFTKPTSGSTNTPSRPSTTQPTKSPFKLPTLAFVQLCERDVQACPNSITVVSRDPFHDCDFFPCPNDPDVSDQFQTCEQDLYFCINGPIVTRNPLQNCEFFPCPGNDPPTTTSSFSPSKSPAMVTTNGPVTSSPQATSSAPSKSPTTNSPITSSPQETSSTPSKSPTTKSPITSSPQETSSAPSKSPTTNSPITSSPQQPSMNLFTSESPTLWPTTTSLTSPSPTSRPISSSPSASPIALVITNSPTPRPPRPRPPPTSAPPTTGPSSITETPTPRPTTSSPTTMPPTTMSPTSRPTTLPPSASPTTVSPTDSPSFRPTTGSPTLRPTTAVWLSCSGNPTAASCASVTTTTPALLEKCVSSDTIASDRYGNALAITTRSNNNDVYAIVGASFHSISGSAYLVSYDRTSRQWSHVAEFVPGGASANGGFDGTSQQSSYDQFGFDVAITNDWVAISAPFDTASQGKVSLFRLDSVRNGEQLEPDAELLASDKDYLTRFGSSVAIDGDTLVVGASRDRDKLGSAYIFQYDALVGGWMETVKLEPDNVSADSQGNFGHSVAILAQDGIVVVAAPYDGSQGRRRNGSVFIYSESSSSYTLLQKIVPSQLLSGDQFGSSLATETSVNPITNAREVHIAIGAKLRDDKGIDSGSVYMYVRREGETEFSFEQRLVASTWSPGAEMGTSVDMEGHKIIVGAKKHNGQGGAHYFTFDGVTWINRGVVTPSGNNDGDDFGSAVALTSDVALVGSYSNDDVGEDSGAIYSYAVCS